MYCFDCLILVILSGVATGEEWSLGTPYLGSSGATGGVIMGTLYNWCNRYNVKYLIFVCVLCDNLPRSWDASREARNIKVIFVPSNE